MRTTAKIATFTALALSCMPIIRHQSYYDVEVDWSFQEATPTNHTVTIQGDTFVVPAGKSVLQVHRLKGGGSAALVYANKGWGFLGQQLVVDGEEVSLSRIHRSNERGTLRILGMGFSPAMKAKIALDIKN
jgi:hypothetical protein